MRKFRLIVGLVSCLVAACSSTPAPYEPYFFIGHVYDGSTGERLTKFTLNLQYLGQNIGAGIDSTGYYSVGPLAPYQDFTISITATGYRSFLSHNPMLADPAIKTEESFYYDAYLFPTSLQTPDVTFSILGSDTAAPPVSGIVRLQPTASSETYGLTPAGINDGGVMRNQLWINSDDLQAATFSAPFMGATLDIPAGSLVYGVTYDVSIFGVGNYQEYDSRSHGVPFTAGVDGSQSFVLTPLSQSPLAAVFNSGAQPGVLTMDYGLTIVFNQPIALDPTQLMDDVTDAINDNFSIDAPDTNGNGMTNTLNGPPAMTPHGDYRGVDFIINGNNLQLSWSLSKGLMTADPGDPIFDVSYGGLDSIMIRPQNNPTAPSASVGSLIRAGSQTVVGAPR
jgi:hypothetical protein